MAKKRKKSSSGKRKSVHVKAHVRGAPKKRKR